MVIQQLLDDAGSGGWVIRQAGPVTDRTFEISFAGPGIQAFAWPQMYALPMPAVG
jgi:hypothetical protein